MKILLMTLFNGGGKTLKYLSLLLVIPLVHFLFKFEKKMGVISKQEFDDEKLKKKRIYSLALIFLGFFFLFFSFAFINFSIKESGSLVIYFALIFSLFFGLVSFSSGLWHLIASILHTRKAMINGGAILFIVSFLILGLAWLCFKDFLMPKISSQSQIPSILLFLLATISLICLSMLGSSLTILFNALKKK